VSSEISEGWEVNTKYSVGQSDLIYIAPKSQKRISARIFDVS